MWGGMRVQFLHRMLTHLHVQIINRWPPPAAGGGRPPSQGVVNKRSSYLLTVTICQSRLLHANNHLAKLKGVVHDGAPRRAIHDRQLFFQMPVADLGGRRADCHLFLASLARRLEAAVR